MTHRSICIASFLATVSLLFAGAAGAQERRAKAPADPLVFGDGATYEVKFDDDPLGALSSDIIVPRIEVRGGFAHAGLMRPRTQFVVEMLKSVEAI
jgi:hypothetical protein